MASGGQACEVSCPIPETEEIASHLLNVSKRQPVFQQSDFGGSSVVNQSILSGGEVTSREESSTQELAACQLVNEQQQRPRYQQITQANGLSHPTQEMGLDTRPRQTVGKCLTLFRRPRLLQSGRQMNTKTLLFVTNCSMVPTYME